MTKIIGIDCDDVLCETIHECLKTSFFTERNIKKADITSYNLRECPNLNITLAEAKKVFFDFFSSEQYRDTQPIPGAREKLESWKAEGHKLVMITGRAQQFEDVTKQRINQHFPHVFDDFIFTNRLTDQELCKSDYCKQLGVSVMVEDYLSPQFASGIVQHRISCFLLDKPRNQSELYQNTPGVMRVKSRDEINLSSIVHSHE